MSARVARSYLITGHITRVGIGVNRRNLDDIASARVLLDEGSDAVDNAVERLARRLFGRGARVMGESLIDWSYDNEIGLTRVEEITATDRMGNVLGTALVQL